MPRLPVTLGVWTDAVDQARGTGDRVVADAPTLKVDDEVFSILGEVHGEAALGAIRAAHRGHGDPDPLVRGHVDGFAGRDQGTRVHVWNGGAGVSEARVVPRRGIEGGPRVEGWRGVGAVPRVHGLVHRRSAPDEGDGEGQRHQDWHGLERLFHHGSHLARNYMIESTVYTLYITTPSAT